MTLLFRYKVIQVTGGKGRKRPMVPVVFSNGEVSFEIACLLDSGADYLAINQEMAEVLGLDLSGPREPCKTPSGSAEAVQSSVSIRIYKGHESYSLFVPVKVLLIPDNGTPPLLGRTGFFDEFEITFNDREGKIWLKKLTTGKRSSKRGSP
jgi:predicted aspartyl protease